MFMRLWIMWLADEHGNKHRPFRYTSDLDYAIYCMKYPGLNGKWILMTVVGN